MSAKQKTKTKIDAVKQIEKPKLPNWPPLKPVLSADQLAFREDLKDQILVISNLFTANLCKTYVSFLSTLSLATTPGKPKRGEAVRVNDRYQVDDPVFARRLWQETALQPLIESYPDKGIWGGQVLGLNPNIRVYRYRPGQFFDRHIDESNKLVNPDGTAAKTTWTLLIYLTVCEGGATVFYPEAPDRRSAAPEPIVVDPQTGSALLHRHEPDCLLHEGREVLSGEKWVLRSDLIVRR